MLPSSFPPHAVDGTLERTRRLSPEKNAMLFAAIIEELGAQRLADLGVTPVLCGSTCVEVFQ